MDMELAYVWIGENETGFIKNQGFNFLPNYRFDMEFREGLGYKLNCTQIDAYPNVWKTDNIVGLTAVVGENGTGKTSLMNWILGAVNDGIGLRLYKNGNDFYAWYRLNHEITFWAENVHTNNKFGVLQAPLYLTNARRRPSNSLQDSFAIFSPDSDIRHHFTPGTQYLYSEIDVDIFESLYGKGDYIDFSKIAIIYYYRQRFKKAKRQGSQEEEPLLNVNSVLTIGFSRNFENLLKRLINKCKNHTVEFHRHALQLFRTAYRETPYFVEKAWVLLLLELTYLTGGWESALDALSHGMAKAGAHALWDLLKNTRRCDPELLAYYMHAIKEITRLEKLLNPLDGRGTKSSKKEATGNTIMLSYAEYPEIYSTFCQFISVSLHKKNSFILQNLSFDLSDLSSGEWAMQNVCAWLLIASKSKMRKTIIGSKSILLLLDEVDLYMHPEWQRKFLYFLSKELALQFKDYCIQIVITTHSPLVLSDIPSGNIIYLGKKGCECVVENGPETRETFGANIHTLLKDSFYLERSLGEFAYSRIREVIDDLQGLKNWGKENPTEKQRKLEEKFTREEHQEKCRAHKQMIDIIGEPIIKGKLQRLYAELFSDDLDIRIESRLTDFRHILKTMSDAERERYMAELEHVMTTMKKRRDEV